MGTDAADDLSRIESGHCLPRPDHWGTVDGVDMGRADPFANAESAEQARRRAVTPRLLPDACTGHTPGHVTEGDGLHQPGERVGHPQLDHRHTRRLADG